MGQLRQYGTIRSIFTTAPPFFQLLYFMRSRLSLPISNRIPARNASTHTNQPIKHIESDRKYVTQINLSKPQRISMHIFHIQIDIHDRVTISSLNFATDNDTSNSYSCCDSINSNSRGTNKDTYTICHSRLRFSKCQSSSY